LGYLLALVLREESLCENFFKKITVFSLGNKVLIRRFKKKDQQLQPYISALSPEKTFKVNESGSARTGVEEWKRRGIKEDIFRKIRIIVSSSAINCRGIGEEPFL